MNLVDRKTLRRGRRTHGGAHPRRQPAPVTRDLEETGARDLERKGELKPEPTGDNGVPPSGPQRPAPPITKQAPIGPPGVAGKMGQPAPEREPPDFGWLVLLGAIFGLAVLKELLGRIGGPVVVTVKSVPRLPASFWIAGGVGTLGRIGARVLGLRSGL